MYVKKAKRMVINLWHNALLLLIMYLNLLKEGFFWRLTERGFLSHFTLGLTFERKIKWKQSIKIFLNYLHIPSPTLPNRFSALSPWCPYILSRTYSLLGSPDCWWHSTPSKRASLSPKPLPPILQGLRLIFPEVNRRFSDNNQRFSGNNQRF